MIVLSQSQSFESHFARCFAGRELVTLVRSLKGVPAGLGRDDDLAVVHWTSCRNGEGPLLVEHLRERGFKIAVASDVPSVEEYLAVSELGVRAYVNSYMSDVQYQQMVEVVGQGQVWLVPPILERVVALARRGADVTEEGLALTALTPREREVASGVARGLSNRQIAERCGISEPTVKVHLGRVFKKLEVKNRHALAVRLQGVRHAS